MIEQLMQASMDPPLLSLKPRQLYRKRADDEVEEAQWYEPGTQELIRPRKIRLQSVSSNDEAIVNFENTTSSKIRVLWIDFKGNEIAYSIIPPKTTKRYKTYVTHPWIARDIESGQRMLLGTRQVVYAFAGEQTVKIDWPPRVHWKLSAAKVYPEEFRNAVNGLLLAHQHLQQFPDDVELSGKKHHMRSFRNLGFLRFCKAAQYAQDDVMVSCPGDQLHSRPGSTLGSIPSDLVLGIISALAAQYDEVYQDISLPEEFRPDVFPALLPLPPPEAIQAANVGSGIMPAY